MKIGSVKFFKIVILACVGLIILVPIILTIVFGLKLSAQKNKTKQLQQQMLNQQATPNTPFLQEDELIPSLEVSPSFEYQQKYENLYANAPLQWQKETNKKVCYLTFDDGPSKISLDILRVLDENDIKATFFVTGKASTLNADILKQISDAGHTIGVHTYSHDYKEIYASVDAFLTDFNKMFEIISEITGKKPEIFRFPGGSVNIFNKQVYAQIVAEMLRRGFIFYDWNAAASDAVNGGLSKQQVVSNVLNSAKGQDKIIVLMHDRDNTATTAQALPDIISQLKKEDYVFKPISNEVEPVAYYFET